jgi:hypothetical protein
VVPRVIGALAVTGNKNKCKTRNEAESKSANIAEDKWVQCEICEGWHHVSCVGLDDNEYEVI